MEEKAQKNSQTGLTQEEENLSNVLAQEAGFTPGEDIDLESIQDVPIEVSVVLGETQITVDQLLKMGTGSVIELNRKVGEAVDLFVNNRCVARGEVVVVDDKIGITMTEIIKGGND